jgi:glyoxylase-like metal-dependent hydrolase (beta-lactamase superfamily II)
VLEVARRRALVRVVGPVPLAPAHDIGGVGKGELYRSALADNYASVEKSGQLTLVDDDAEIMPGVRTVRTGGHTAHHQLVRIESRGQTAVFMADLIPTAAHVPLPWIMGYDLYPMDTLAFKRSFLTEAATQEYLVFFEHEPAFAAGHFRTAGDAIVLERA